MRTNALSRFVRSGRHPAPPDRLRSPDMQGSRVRRPRGSNLSPATNWSLRLDSALRSFRRRKPRGCSSMSLLRRPDDHHRNLRRRTPCTFAVAEPDQDRHLMSDGSVLTPSQRRSPSTPANRRSRRDLPTRGPQTPAKRRTHAVHSWRRRQPTPLTSSITTKPPASGSRSDTRAQPATFKSP